MTEDGTVQWRALVAEAIEALRQVGAESPEVDVRRMVEQATGCEPSEYHTLLGALATRRAVAAFDQMLARRRTGEPLQYVVGHWSFRTVELMVDRRVLIPRPETEFLVDHALAEIDRLRDQERSRLTAVDLGTGSGAIACSLVAERQRLEVWATDRSSDALAVARANVAGLGRPAKRVHLGEGDWFAALPPDLRGQVDLVVSNPPYVATADELPAVVGEWEPTDALIAGPTGAECVLAILDQAAEWLTDLGVVVMEISPAIAVAARERAAVTGFGRVEVHTDQYDRERVLVAGRGG